MTDKERDAWILDVSTLNRYVAQTMMTDPVLQSARLRGEVSNFKAYPSGHWYFSLKDERSRIACVMFRSSAMRMSFKPSEGDQVILHGSVRLYEEGGQYQFVADSMRPEGVGNLYRLFEQLKAKLQEEGLFDAARKRPLPVRPKKIAIVTSEAGAVLHDIRRVSARRDPGVPLVLLPVQVQGEGAAEQIAAAIRRAGTLKDVEVIITGRGGGSMEDLWAFNEEIVARAIAESPVPVISAVGHETDFTIADFVADVRASTPSNAAELAVPDRSEMRSAFHLLRRRLDLAMENQMNQTRVRLLRHRKELDRLCPDAQIQEMQKTVGSLWARLMVQSGAMLSELNTNVSMAQIRLDKAMDAQWQGAQKRFEQDRTRLESLSPKRVLERGYAMVTSRGHVVTEGKNAPERMTIHFRDGEVRVHREKEE